MKSLSAAYPLLTVLCFAIKFFQFSLAERFPPRYCHAFASVAHHARAKPSFDPKDVTGV